ncbi:MAG: conjugal transfer protein, partial [Chelatococcus sp.]|nr:conjugal transfer protein [Chelatococcus sp.]
MPTADEYRSLELEAAAASSVARGRTALGGFLKIVIPLGAVVIAAWLIYGSLARRTPTLTT